MKDRLEDTVIREYRALAADYDRRWGRYVRSSVRETLRRAEFGRHDSILDIACGTGALLQRIGTLYPEARLHGADISPEMLQMARARLGPAAHLCRARADALPFADSAFDAVVSTNAFHYFPQPEAALEEMARVLKPGGNLVITDWCDDYWTCRLCDLLLRVFDSAHHRVYGSAACHALLDAAGFGNVNVTPYRIDWLWGLMTATGSAASDESGDRHKRL